MDPAARCHCRRGHRDHRAQTERRVQQVRPDDRHGRELPAGIHAARPRGQASQVSIAYAIWSGAGTAAISVIGVYAFDEPLTTAKIIGILLIIGGIVTLNLASPG
jgi:Small Multidrug Resistance protein